MRLRIGVGVLVMMFASTVFGDTGDEPGSNPIAEPPSDDESLYTCKKAKAGAIYVNLAPDTSLKDLVDWAMTFTCKNFVYSSSIGKRSSTVTLIAPGKMSPREAWRSFLVALQSAGLTVVPKGELLEIVEASQAKEKPLPVYKPAELRATDQIVRVIIRPQHASAEDLSTALGAIKTQHGTVTALPKSGIVFITDYGTSIDRMLDVMDEIDRPGDSDRVYILKLEHADPETAAGKLRELFGKDGPTLIAEERVRAILMRSDAASYERARKLLRYIDLPMPGGDGGMYVLKLAHADATKLAQTLNGSIQASASTRGQGGGGRAAAGAGAGATAAIGSDVRVTPDPESNSLVVFAAVEDFVALREIVRELDVARRQVFIEATIVELQLGTSRDLGVTFHAGDVKKIGGKDSLVFGGPQHPGLSSLDLKSTLANAGTSIVAGAIGPGLPGVEEFLGVSVPSFSVLVQALATRGHLDVLSAPHLTALDNVAATISVGQNIPYQSQLSSGLSAGSATGTDATSFGLPGVSVQRQRVGLTLAITPHISDDDTVRLEIEQQLQDIAAPVNDLGPTWTERQLSTTVVVRDQQSIVIGGLMQDKLLTESTKVPLLGDIPVLGQLFRSTHTEQTKTNLLIVLTPYIVNTDADLQRILERKQREQDEFAATLDSFDRARYRPDIDYARRRGVVEEINRSVARVEQERELIREFQETVAFPEGPID
jgi:general secretion pathway protein D